MKEYDPGPVVDVAMSNVADVPEFDIGANYCNLVRGETLVAQDLGDDDIKFGIL